MPSAEVNKLTSHRLSCDPTVSKATRPELLCIRHCHSYYIKSIQSESLVKAKHLMLSIENGVCSNKQTPTSIAAKAVALVARPVVESAKIGLMCKSARPC